MTNNIGTLVIKSIDDRTFTGTISVEVIDHQGDIVPVKALVASMGPYLRTGGQLQLVHSNIPVGKLTECYIGTDPKTRKPSLVVFGQIFNDGRSIFDDVWDKFLDPDEPVGFSIGGKPLMYHTEVIDGKTARILDEIELYEVSVVCSMNGKPHKPANQYAQLVGLGHINAQSMPITVKMVLSEMAKEMEEEEKPSTEEKEVDEDKSPETDIEKSVRSKVEQEAQSMIGSSTAMKALAEEQAKVSSLTKMVNDLNRSIEDINKELDRARLDLQTVEKDKLAAEIEARTWKEVFRKNASDKDALSKMVASGRVVLNEGSVPSNLSAKPSPDVIRKEKEEVDNRNKITEVLKKDMGSMSDEEFLKTTRILSKLGV